MLKSSVFTKFAGRTTYYRFTMGRIFEVRKQKMFARYDRMAKQFTRFGKEIVIAVKAGGPEPENNPTLRRIIQNAKAVNMPKHLIEAAIKRAVDKDTSDYDEVLFEGYAPHGVAILVETATDNNTRTVANVREKFNRGNGNLGTSGSVSFLFNRMGVFRLHPEGLDQDELELELIDAGLEEMGEDSEGNLIIRCAFTDFGNMQKALEDRDIEPLNSDSEWIPTTTVDLPEEQADEVLKLVDELQSDDDVQKVFHNLK